MADMRTDASSTTPTDSAARRSFIVRLAAIVTGGIAALFPFAVGLGVIIDPWRRSRRDSGDRNEPSSEGFVRVCPLDAIPPDGTPRAFPVVSKIVDAWTRSANQRIGMIFVSRTDTGGKSSVTVFNARCPHLGCFVDFNPTDGHFECPCHKSAFDKDGKQLYGPSRRGLDSLTVKVDQSEVLVAFQNFQTGIPERKPIE